jgi:excisionase family DNA binding protein
MIQLLISKSNDIIVQEVVMAEQLVSVTQCAERKGITRQSVLQAIQRGDLSAEKVGNNYVIREADCEAYEPAREPGERARRRWKKVNG